MLERVPLWFHTFLSRRRRRLYAGHRAGSPLPPARDTAGPDRRARAQRGRVRRVLRLSGRASRGSPRGRRGQRAVRRLDPPQMGIDLVPGAGFRAIAELLGSGVDYRRLDALGVDRLGETFDVILCFGILHRVEAPLTLMRVLGECLAQRRRMTSDLRRARRAGRRACSSMSAATRDDAVFWGFSRSSLDRLGRFSMRGSSSWTRPRSRVTRGSSARSRRADQAAWSRRSGRLHGQLVRAVGGERVGRVRARARARRGSAGVAVPVVMGRASAGSSLTSRPAWFTASALLERGRWRGEELEEGDRFVARPVALAAPTSSRPRSRGSCRSDGRSRRPRW